MKEEAGKWIDFFSVVEKLKNSESTYYFYKNGKVLTIDTSKGLGPVNSINWKTATKYTPVPISTFRECLEELKE